jgi:hypothetical protein
MTPYISAAYLKAACPLSEWNRDDVISSLEELQGMAGDETSIDGMSLDQLLSLHEKLSDELQSQLGE